jgi:hypothetical protein
LTVIVNIKPERAQFSSPWTNPSHYLSFARLLLSVLKKVERKTESGEHNLMPKKFVIGGALLLVVAIIGILYIKYTDKPLAPQQETSIVSEYVSEHISQLSPIKEQLGGTYYVTHIEVTSGKGVTSYEDGHNAYVADFKYTLDEKGIPSITSFVIRLTH